MNDLSSTFGMVERRTRKTGRCGGSSFLIPYLSGRAKWKYWLAYALWLTALINFWIWWLQPAHNIGTGRFIAVSLVLFLSTGMPFYTLTIFLGARTPRPDLSLPRSARVAMVVTKAPSEPFSVLQETLTAMLNQDVLHATWLADEDPSVETIVWCIANGVMISTRKDRPDYHRSTWPRRTRCKEGNLAFFYDNYGYEKYDFVVQLDADHVPAPDYLRHMLAPFVDPTVGYVSAPSICDRNAGNSWSARSRLYAEGILHGALQTGYTNGWAPLCFGSHYAVRTKALKQIGGLGPELAEDHSTTLMMNAQGWRGVHALDAIANGDGPQTFADLATQEFQWSRSVMMLLLKYTPGYLGNLGARLKFQFLFCQLWYSLFSILMAAAFLIPVAAIIFDANFSAVNFPQFLLHFIPVTISLHVINYMFQSNGWWRPRYAKSLSWEVMLFPFARWPWALAGILSAVRDWLTGTFVDFRVTPKGAGPSTALPTRVIMPYVFLSVGSALPAMFVNGAWDARGFYLFAIINSAIYAAILVVVLIRHAIENRLDWDRAVRRQAMLAAVVCAFPLIGFAQNGIEGVDGMAVGAEPLKLTRATYGASGAGQSTSSARKLRFEIWWDSPRAAPAKERS